MCMEGDGERERERERERESERERWELLHSFMHVASAGVYSASVLGDAMNWKMY